MLSSRQAHARMQVICASNLSAFNHDEAAVGQGGRTTAGQISNVFRSAATRTRSIDQKLAGIHGPPAINAHLAELIKDNMRTAALEQRLVSAFAVKPAGSIASEQAVNRFYDPILAAASKTALSAATNDLPSLCVSTA